MRVLSAAPGVEQGCKVDFRPFDGLVAMACHSRKPGSQGQPFRSKRRYIPYAGPPFVLTMLAVLVCAAFMKPAQGLGLPILDDDEGTSQPVQVEVTGDAHASLCVTSVSIAAAAVSPTAAALEYDWSASGAHTLSVVAVNTFLSTLAAGASGKITAAYAPHRPAGWLCAMCTTHSRLVALLATDVDVPSSLLVAGASYTFSVHVEDADGASGTASTTVTMSSLEPPVIVPLVPTALTVQRSNDTQLGISATVSDCLLGAIVSSALSVGWAQVAGPNVTLSIDSGNPSQVVIPGGAFTAGAQYTFRVTVAVSSLPLLSSSLDFTIAEVVLAPLVAVIQPIAAEVSNTDPLTLDAGSSYVVVCHNSMASVSQPLACQVRPRVSGWRGAVMDMELHGGEHSTAMCLQQRHWDCNALRPHNNAGSRLPTK